jgi:hypothetical protein
MYELIGLVLLGLALFIGGQWYGYNQARRKSLIATRMTAMGFEAYRTALSAVLTAKGMSLSELDQEAIHWNLAQMTNKLKAMSMEHLAKHGSPPIITSTTEIIGGDGNEVKDDSKNGKTH